LDPGRVGQIDDVILHAELFAPLRFTTGAEVEVALLRMDDAGVALRQLLEAGIAITLIEALAGVATTMHAVDLAGELQLQRLADERVERHQAVAQWQVVGHRSGEPGSHLAGRAVCCGGHACSSCDPTITVSMGGAAVAVDPGDRTLFV